MRPLEGKIALVTGASRNAGRGIAENLGAAGARVYITARTRYAEKGADRRATLAHTVELVAARGGVAIPVVCDHTNDSDVEALFAQIQREQGRLDILVNNIWGGYEDYFEAAFDAPFWEQPMTRWDKMFTSGARAHYSASRLAAPMMIAQGSGLIVNTGVWDRDKYFRPLVYNLAKTTINRMAYGMALELKGTGVTAVALALGWLRTDYIKDHYKVDDYTYKDNPAVAPTESTEYIGQAVVALATDPSVHEKAGRTLTTGGLAREYNFTDLDGTQPAVFQIPDDWLLD